MGELGAPHHRAGKHKGVPLDVTYEASLSENRKPRADRQARCFPAAPAPELTLPWPCVPGKHLWQGAPGREQEGPVVPWFSLPAAHPLFPASAPRRPCQDPRGESGCRIHLWTSYILRVSPVMSPAPGNRMKCGDAPASSKLMIAVGESSG